MIPRYLGMPEMNSGVFGIFNNLSVKKPNNIISSARNPEIVLLTSDKPIYNLSS